MLAEVSPRGGGDVVVDVADGGAGVAAGEPTAPVAGHHVVGEFGWWPVDDGAVVEQVAGDRVDDQPPPVRFGGPVAHQGGGDGAVAEQFGGVVGQPEQATAGR